MTMRGIAWRPAVLSVALVVGAGQLPAGQPATPQTPPPQPRLTERAEIPLALFKVPEGFEVTLWAGSPMLRNPTNIDIDRDGRIWVAEGVRYRQHHARQPEGDRIVVLQDTDGDGRADASHTFVQEPGLVAPLGVAVIDNKVVVSQPPNLLVYTDVDRNLRFDPAVDTRDVLLTGFQGINHDHSLHSVTVGPDGKWVFNSGNMGARFTDRSGRTFTSFSSYRADPIGPFTHPHDARQLMGARSDDGHVYVGGFAARMNPDGTNVEIIGHNFRNSYEQATTSLGDVFHSDNDDPPACRVSWMMEYANFGFSSADGQRTWQADRRPGQGVPAAEWRQDDPGTAPAGDVYGGGSPTGVVFYENGALGDAWRGTLFAAEPGRNVIFAYQPVRDGAGFRLERRDFMATNQEGQWAGTDFNGGPRTATAEISTLFRPSDIAVGPDGALYVSDWIDPIVGFHQDLDDAASGAIYRIAPRRTPSKAPTFDASTIDGATTALRSPAVNVRAIGFTALRARGAAGVAAVGALLDDPDPYVRGRALFLLQQMGPEGRARAGAPASHTDPAMRIASLRAMRRAGLDVDATALGLARDADAGVRREAALAMRDRPEAAALPVLLEVAKGFDGTDRAYLEALGTGATGKETALYEALVRDAGARDPLRWSSSLAWIAWRLHPVAAVGALSARAKAEALPIDERRRAMDALAFIDTRAASATMVDLAAGRGPLREGATWWLLNRSTNTWQDHDLLPAMKRWGIYDPDATRVEEMRLQPRPATSSFTSADVMTLTGSATRGEAHMTRCLMCHAVTGTGADVGPALDGWTRGKSLRTIVTAIVEPDAGIAHGYIGTTVVTTDGLTIQGLPIKEGDPVMIRGVGGATQVVPASRIKSRERLTRSVMMGAQELGLSAQDVADLIAYLRTR
ncbi:MAG TPA: PVC-type heme-binding CxxCH protein [Luteitalea sp.]|nr:PVC-type heme-binding CxxCH protein [Luteitalea sp.]